MAHRHISTRQFFIDLIRDHEPELTFKGSTEEDFGQWHAAFRAKFIECVGPLPPDVDLAPDVEWSVEEDGLIKERVLLETAPFTTVPAIVLRPPGTARSERQLPAIIAIHGHGQYGKDPVAGAAYAEAARDVEYFNYSYGLQMAKHGYVVICPDMRPFGERSDHHPGERPLPGRDPCNVHALKGWLLGFNLFSYNLWDLMKCLDYLAGLPFVDSERIGAMGLSGGGTSTMYFAALDQRVRAADIICATNSYRGYAVGRDNFCGTQFLPGIFKYGDQAEICGLIAPRPLLIESGGFDYGFPIDHTMRAHKQIRRIFDAAGVAERLEIVVGAAGHQHYPSVAEPFFDRWLGESE